MKGPPCSLVGCVRAFDAGDEHTLGVQGALGGFSDRVANEKLLTWRRRKNNLHSTMLHILLRLGAMLPCIPRRHWDCGRCGRVMLSCGNWCWIGFSWNV